MLEDKRKLSVVFVGKLFQWTCDYIIARLMADSFSRLSLVRLSVAGRSYPKSPEELDVEESPFSGFDFKR